MKFRDLIPHVATDSILITGQSCMEKEQTINYFQAIVDNPDVLDFLIQTVESSVNKDGYVCIGDECRFLGLAQLLVDLRNPSNSNIIRDPFSAGAVNERLGSLSAGFYKDRIKISKPEGGDRHLVTFLCSSEREAGRIMPRVEDAGLSDFITAEIL